MIPKSKNKNSVQESKIVHHSAPVNIPDWSRFMYKFQEEIGNFVTNKYNSNFGSDDDEEVGKKMMKCDALHMNGLLKGKFLLSQCVKLSSCPISKLNVHMFDTNIQIPTSFDPLAEAKEDQKVAPSASGSRGAKYRGSPGVSGSRGAKDIEIPTAFDPFAEANHVGASGTKEYVHIRIQQRNNRKSLTTIQGLKKEFNYGKILKDLKEEFCCNGNVVLDKELGKVIQLQGDQRKDVSQFLLNADIVKKEQIKIHGF
ncbi:hypothetical protein HAX54_001920 [Datura stramonium]|uniref:SUI1 domain-containing protein n=1 Tax=Datura stramonium TaxID=4076 RepID=A0ABS8RSV2_DATST|nr:hypothetical protein [Datura stramonium]